MSYLDFYTCPYCKNNTIRTANIMEQEVRISCNNCPVETGIAFILRIEDLNLKYLEFWDNDHIMRIYPGKYWDNIYINKYNHHHSNSFPDLKNNFSVSTTLHINLFKDKKYAQLWLKNILKFFYPKFQIGDSVTFIGGGPKIRVQKISYYGEYKIDEPQILCEWFDKNDVFHSQLFNSCDLVLDNKHDK